MKKEELFKEVKKILIEKFEIEESKIVMDANIVTDLDLDSIDIIDLIITLNTMLKLNVSAADFKDKRTLSEILDVICNVMQQ